MKMKKAILPFLVLAALVPMLFVHSCANTTDAPSGGLKDTIPPVIVMIDPLPGQTEFPLEGGSVVFTFDEYVAIKDPKNIFLSPPQSRQPDSRIRGKRLVVSFPEPLLPNTTYTINFPDAIADNNEGNMFPGFTYVFSTGDQIDSCYLTGVVNDSNTLSPVKGARVLLYKDQTDSAVFNSLPYAAAVTDAWGFFAISFIQDTLYRMYAVEDQDGNSRYSPETERIAFIDSLVRPLHVVNDTVPELLKYDMTDTLACRARVPDFELQLFQERNNRQFLRAHERVAPRAAYITFGAWDAWVDTLWVRGYPADHIITQFNTARDSMEIWINDRRPVPDTLSLMVNYRKTNADRELEPVLEESILALEKKVQAPARGRNRVQHTDTICLFSVDAKPELVEQEGISLSFALPIIYEQFDSVRFVSINPKQVRTSEPFRFERDSLNLLHYVIRPEIKYQTGWEYELRIPEGAFTDINGFRSDSLTTKFKLPDDEKLSTLILDLVNPQYDYVVDLMDSNLGKTFRTFRVHEATKIVIPYLQEGSYAIRIFEDVNGNSLLDAGSLLELRQSEKVRTVQTDGDRAISIPSSSEIEQTVDLTELFKD